MTAEERETIRQWVAETRRAQGLPRHVEDEATLVKIARLLDLAEAEGGEGRGRKTA